MKQYKEECDIVMHKLARIAGIIVNLCEKCNLSEENVLINRLEYRLTSLFYHQSVTVRLVANVVTLVAVSDSAVCAMNGMALRLHSSEV